MGNENFDKFMVSPDASAFAKASVELEGQLGKMARGEVNPRQLYKDLEAQHASLVQGNAWPGASSVKGHRQVPIVYRQLGGFLVKMKWDFLPDIGGPTVLAVCPACYYNAPTNVNTKNATKPIAVDNQLARLVGDPEADKKLVPFRLSYPAFHCYLNETGGKLRLTIQETIKCVNHYRCSFIVKVRDSIAERVSSRVFRSTEGKGGPLKGPLIIVK